LKNKIAPMIPIIHCIDKVHTIPIILCFVRIIQLLPNKTQIEIIYMYFIDNFYFVNNCMSFYLFSTKDAICIAHQEIVCFTFCRSSSVSWNCSVDEFVWRVRSGFLWSYVFAVLSIACTESKKFIMFCRCFGMSCFSCAVSGIRAREHSLSIVSGSECSIYA